MPTSIYEIMREMADQYEEGVEGMTNPPSEEEQSMIDRAIYIVRKFAYALEMADRM